MRNHLSLRSGNPALNQKTFKGLQANGTAMTIDGTINKTSIALILLVLSAYYTYSSGNTSYIFLGLIGGIILAIATFIKKQWSPITVPIYAIFEGLALGGISVIYESMYTGIVQQAIFLTFGIFATLLFAYKTKIIQATENFKLGVFAATGGIAIVYFISFMFNIFNAFYK